jgi:hypothetical protein
MSGPRSMLLPPLLLIAPLPARPETPRSGGELLLAATRLVG